MVEIIAISMAIQVQSMLKKNAKIQRTKMTDDTYDLGPLHEYRFECSEKQSLSVQVNYSRQTHFKLRIGRERHCGIVWCGNPEKPRFYLPRPM